MTDITKCANGECELRFNCWRFIAPINENWQSYSMFECVDGECENYWKVPLVKV